jgi:hypothetical protein
MHELLQVSGFTTSTCSPKKNLSIVASHYTDQANYKMDTAVVLLFFLPKRIMPLPAVIPSIQTSPVVHGYTLTVASQQPTVVNKMVIAIDELGLGLCSSHLYAIVLSS